MSRRGAARQRVAEAEGGAEELLRRLRGSLASLRSAAEALELATAPEQAASAARLRAVVVEEAARLSELLDEAGLLLRPPGERRRRRSLRAILVELARRARSELDLALVEGADGVESRIAGGPPLLEALLGVLAELRRDFALQRIEVRSRLHRELAVVDLVWKVSEPDLNRLRERQGELLAGGSPPRSRSTPPRAPSLRAVMQELRGEVWLSLDRRAALASLRLLLPVG